MKAGPLASAALPWSALILGLLDLAACAGANAPPPVRVVGDPERLPGVVTAVVGAAPVQDGQSCDVYLSRTDHPSFNCRIRVRCEDEILYGLADAGFNRCVERDGKFVGAEDGFGTRRDGDPRMRLDLDRGELVVSDRDPDVEIVVALQRGQ